MVEKDTPGGGNSVSKGTKEEKMREPMDSIKYISGGKFGRGVAWGKKGLWQRKRARAESIFLLFFWRMRLGQRPSSRRRAANTNLQPQ